MAKVFLAGARIDEHGNISGGNPGDQNGREVVNGQPWYKHPKGWYVLRPVSAIDAEIIAATAEALGDNNNIGYNQRRRTTLLAIGNGTGYNVAAVTTKCDCDCSKFVQFCLFAAGIKAGKWNDEFRTGNMIPTMLATGRFVKLTASKYTGASTLLMRGDILVTKVSGHTMVVVSDGAKVVRNFGDRPLSIGCDGPDVTILQQHLKTLGYGSLLGHWGENKDGVDGDYGSSTANAVKRFQKDHGLYQNGRANLDTIDKIVGAVNNQIPIIDVPDEPDEPDDANDDDEPDTNEPPVTEPVIPDYKCQWVIATASLNVRTGPSTKYKKKISLFKGTGLMYLDETKDGWYAVLYRGTKHWVSSKHSKLEVHEKYMVDMSVYDHVKNWDEFVKYISFAWLRVACRKDTADGVVYIDANFKKYASELKKRGVPFGVYVYGRADTKARGIWEAYCATTWAEPYGPMVYMYDIEAPTLTFTSCQAFIDETKRITGKPCGIYVGIHWRQVDAGNLRRDYTVCPYYRDNGGGTHGDREPSHPHDGHQYSCSLIVPGKEDPGDVSHINQNPKTNGTGRTIEYFRTGGKVAA